MNLNVATSQYSVRDGIEANADHVLRQMREARASGALLQLGNVLVIREFWPLAAGMAYSISLSLVNFAGLVFSALSNDGGGGSGIIERRR